METLADFAPRLRNLRARYAELARDFERTKGEKARKKINAGLDDLDGRITLYEWVLAGISTAGTERPAAERVKARLLFLDDVTHLRVQRVHPHNVPAARFYLARLDEIKRALALINGTQPERTTNGGPNYPFI